MSSMKLTLAVASACLLGIVKSAVNFGAAEVTALRSEIRELMLSNTAGHIAGSAAVGPTDILFSYEYPVMASSVRLAFHDCTGEFPTKCNGCIGINGGGNVGLFEGSVDPLSSICDDYLDNYQLSRADCWALAATFALELSGDLTKADWDRINAFFDGGLKKRDYPKKAVKPGSIPYYIGRIDCANSPDIDFGVQEEFPRPPDSWDIIQHYFGDRFDLTKKKIVALIAGGHSLGRGHSGNFPFSGPWDVSPNTLDNEYSKALLGENRVLESWNWKNERFLDGPGPAQWFIENEDFTDVYGEPFIIDQAFLMLDADFSLAYNRSYYIRNRILPPFNCRPQATAYCEANYPGSIVLYPGDSADNYPDGTYICPMIQCYLQCRGGYDELNDYINHDFTTIDDNYDGCPIAWIKQFADDENDFHDAFVRAYTTVITAGYQAVHFDSSEDDGIEFNENLDYIYEIDINYDKLEKDNSFDEQYGYQRDNTSN